MQVPYIPGTVCTELLGSGFAPVCDKSDRTDPPPNKWVWIPSTIVCVMMDNYPYLGQEDRKCVSPEVRSV